MMQTLRDKMKYIIITTGVAFVATIIFSWGMGGFKNRSQAEKGIIGIVNGQEIQYRHFYMVLDQQLKQAREQSGGQLDEYRIRSIREQTWNQMIQEILIAQEVRRLNIQATPQEVVFRLRNNPPEAIRNHESFQTDGKFDIAKYYQALNDPQNYNVWLPLEYEMQNQIPMEKLYRQILASVRVTESEARESYRLENEKVNVQYVFYDPNKVDLDSNAISEKEILNYYDKHKEEEFQEPEKRKIQYVLLETKPSSEDSTETWTEANDILRLLQEGADFEEFAREYSEDAGTAEKGGDLGFFGKGAMVKPFEEAAFSAKIRDIVGPVHSQFGLHIIQVLARKKEAGETQVHARHILLKFETSTDTYDDLKSKAEDLYNDVKRTKGKLFKEVFERVGMTVKETPFFQKGRFIPGIGMAARLNHSVFSEGRNWYSEPMYAGENIVLFQITDIQKERFRALEDVKPQIRNKLALEKKKEEAALLCDMASQKIDEGKDLETVAFEDSIEIKETGLFSLQSYILDVGRDAKFAGTAFQMKIGDVSKPIDGNKGSYIIRVIERNEIKDSDFEQVKESKMQTLLQQKQQRIYMAWFNNLKEKAKIEDYRDQFYN